MNIYVLIDSILYDNIVVSSLIYMLIQKKIPSCIKSPSFPSHFKIKLQLMAPI